MKVITNDPCCRREEEARRIAQLEGDDTVFVGCIFDREHYTKAQEIINQNPGIKLAGCVGCDIDMPDIQSPNIFIASSSCNYCAIKKPLKSMPVHILKERIEECWQLGQIPLLMAEDTGCYGHDIGTNIGSLIELLGDGIVHLDNMDAYWFMQYSNILVPALKSGKIGRIVIAAQTFSPRLLRDMGRRVFDARAMMSLLKDLKPEKVELYLMVGHPYETKDDIKYTLKLLTPDIPYTVFKFFRHTGCTIDKPDHSKLTVNARYTLLYNIDHTWMCKVCNMKKWECLC